MSGEGTRAKRRAPAGRTGARLASLGSDRNLLGRLRGGLAWGAIQEVDRGGDDLNAAARRAIGRLPGRAVQGAFADAAEAARTVLADTTIADVVEHERREAARGVRSPHRGPTAERPPLMPRAIRS